ncbi:MAG: hypothetical protein CO138_01665 [Candidatus Moranbacteria bacterium CG_4_9_14_3_um_filter_33_15]|nr:MAG: hypothetical protein COT31_02170 [Candidatus Moranbacteria bacterium CG08_land_8_20_14_0_20_34_16]PJA89224.1 MAG: hypothetical protein CO138_01665 [Candidatus Moranbacteria bacterium CG_4_9_14_3_um_filter_33_15]
MNKFSKKDIEFIIISGLFIVFSVLGVWFLWRNVPLLTVFLFALAFIELNTIKSKKADRYVFSVLYWWRSRRKYCDLFWQLALY